MKKFPKLKLSPKLIKFIRNFIDMEASPETALPSRRIIEYSFVIQRLNPAPAGRVLDIGCVARLNFLPACLASLGWEVYGIDLREFKFKWPNFHLICEDITKKTSFSDDFFDHVYAVSTLENIGMGGRYGVNEDDLQANVKTVNEVKRILKKDGTFLVTVSYGKRSITRHMHRIYDQVGLHDLFQNWKIQDESYYVRSKEGYWEKVPEKVAELVNNKNGENAIALLEVSPLK